MRISAALQALLLSFTLAWSYTYDLDNHPHVVFEVWRADSLPGQFTLWQTTPNLSVSVDTGEMPQRFFRVRAKDTDTGELSDWARASQPVSVDGAPSAR